MSPCALKRDVPFVSLWGCLYANLCVCVCVFVYVRACVCGAVHLSSPLMLALCFPPLSCAVQL